MISTPLKVACGVGTVGMGCYFVTSYLGVDKKERILDKLSKEKFTLLSFENGNYAEWKAVLKEYEKGTNVDTFDGVTLDTSSGDKEKKNIDALKLACKELVYKGDGA